MTGHGRHRGPRSAFRTAALALCAVMAASFGQAGDWAAKMYPSLPEMPVIVPILVALGVGTLVGMVNGLLVAKTLQL